MEEVINGTSVSLIKRWINHILNIIDQNSPQKGPCYTVPSKIELEPDVIMMLYKIGQIFDMKFCDLKNDGTLKYAGPEESSYLKNKLEFILKVIDVK
ncbi:MAG: hypothetical protein ACOYMB_02070 [Patescibacteria group bacterium]